MGLASTSPCELSSVPFTLRPLLPMALSPKVQHIETTVNVLNMTMIANICLQQYPWNAHINSLVEAIQVKKGHTTMCFDV